MAVMPIKMDRGAKKMLDFMSVANKVKTANPTIIEPITMFVMCK